MTSRSLNPHEPAYTKAARKADRKAAKVQNRIARRALRRASLVSLSLSLLAGTPPGAVAVKRPDPDQISGTLKTAYHTRYTMPGRATMTRGSQFAPE